MSTFKNRLRIFFIGDWSIEAGVLLIFVLPPIGMLWLFLLGWRHIQRMMKEGIKFPYNITFLFFLCLLAATIGAALTARKLEYALVFAMLLGYLGLYIRVKERFRISHFNGYQRMVIAGGCYSILSRFLPESMRANSIWGLLLGTKWIGGNTMDPRLVGTAYNPNFASFLLLISFSLVLGKLLGQKDVIHSFKRLYWLLVLFLGYGIVATQSRACVVTMVIIFLMYLVRRQRKLGLWASGAVAVLMPLLLHIMPRSNLIGMSTSVREQIWLNSIRIWEQHPFFGTTPLGFQAAYSAYGAPVPHAHNILLAFFSEYGTLGGLGFVILLSWMIVNYLSLVKCSSRNKRMLDSFILTLPILLFTGIFDHPMSSPQTALVVMPLLAFWDRYTVSLPILANIIKIGGRYSIFRTAYQSLVIIPKGLKKIEQFMLNLISQNYKFINYLSLFLIIIELLLLVRVI